MSLTPTYGSMMDESDKGNEHSAAAVTAQETHSDNADASSASPTASNQGSGDNTAQPGADPGQGSYQGYQGSSRVDNRSTRVAGMFKGVGKRFGTTVTKGAHLITGGLKDWVKHNPDIPSFRTFFRHAHFHKSYLGMFISFVFYGLVIWHSLLSHDRTVKGLLWVFVVVWFAIMQLLLKFLVLREPRAKDTQEELEMSPIRDTPINTLLTRMLTLELYRDADKTVKYQFSQMRRVIFGSVVFTSCLQLALFIVPPVYRGIYCGVEKTPDCFDLPAYVNLYGASFGAAMAAGIGTLADVAIALFLLLKLHTIQMQGYMRKLKSKRLSADPSLHSAMGLLPPSVAVEDAPAYSPPQVGSGVIGGGGGGSDLETGDAKAPLKAAAEEKVTMSPLMQAYGGNGFGGAGEGAEGQGHYRLVPYPYASVTATPDSSYSGGSSVGPAMVPQDVLSVPGEQFKFVSRPCRNVFEEYLRIQALVDMSAENWGPPLLIWFLAVVFIFSVNLYIILSEGGAKDSNVLNTVTIVVSLVTFLIPFLVAVGMNDRMASPAGVVRRSKPTDFMALGGRDALMTYYTSNSIVFTVYNIPLTQSYLVGFITTSGIGFLIAWIRFLS